MTIKADTMSIVKQKVYCADRRRLGTRVMVLQPDGGYFLPHVRRHSESFEWGYGGSGPADLALSLLTDCVGPEMAQQLYGNFKWEVVAGLPEAGWKITENAIRSWVARQQQLALEVQS